ncbi:hypothetical protein T492DRAFT_889986 [Pavlovales sp. CCMP2436]|nr:hypothetical protein T492DRAFT_889986 [Pavlovales sp. CCMP2436]
MGRCSLVDGFSQKLPELACRVAAAYAALADGAYDDQTFERVRQSVQLAPVNFGFGLGGGEALGLIAVQLGGGVGGVEALGLIALGGGEGLGLIALELGGGEALGLIAVELGGGVSGVEALGLSALELCGGLELVGCCPRSETELEVLEA